MSRKPNPDGLIAQAIVKAGLTQTEVAERSGINPARISRFATGAQTPTPEQLAVLAEVIGVPAHQLLPTPDWALR